MANEELWRELDLDGLRHEMVQVQLRNRGVRDAHVLEAMASVPRHEFVPVEFREHAYDDQPISIGEGQTISQPYMVAVMIEAMALTGAEKVLEIGAGSGYAAAIISRLAKHVYAVESHASLALAAQQRLSRLGFNNVSIHTGDGSAGLKEAAPFDVIVVAAAAPSVPQPLVEQLSEDGRLVIPVGDAQSQNLVLIQKAGGEIHSSTLHQCRFVPLVGRYGFGS
jgi:protein-L-isoaspartate(D-aspartate) O-methyltransferase